MKKRLVAIVLSVVVMATACGGGSDDSSSSSQAPGGPIAATCAIGNPDCADTSFGNAGDPVGTPNTIVPGEVNGVGLDGVPIDGGLTVPEALATDVTGMVAVKGFVVTTADGVKLCELLAESFPPQCGGASLTLDVTDVADLRVLEPVPYTEQQGVTWTDSFVTLFGNVVAGGLVVA